LNTHDLSEGRRLALSVRDVADLLGVSERHIWKLERTARLPKALKVGRCVRWRRADIESWVSAGCPSRDAWAAPKGGVR